MSIVEGWLTKRSKWIKAWRRRYCWLLDSTLIVSKNEQDTKAHHYINLVFLQEVTDNKQEKTFKIKLTTGQSYLFRAENDLELTIWRDALKRCLNQRPFRMKIADFIENRIGIMDEHHLMYEKNDFGATVKKIDIVDMSTWQKAVLRQPAYVGKHFFLQREGSTGYTAIVIFEDDHGNIAKTVLINDVLQRVTEIISSSSSPASSDPSVETQSSLLFTVRGYKPIDKFFPGPRSLNMDTNVSLARLSMDSKNVITFHGRDTLKIWNVSTKQLVKIIRLDGKILSASRMIIMNESTLLIAVKMDEGMIESWCFIKVDFTTDDSSITKQIHGKSYKEIVNKFFPIFPSMKKEMMVPDQQFGFIHQVLRISDSLFLAICCSDKKDRRNKLYRWNTDTMLMEGEILHPQAHSFECLTLVPNSHALFPSRIGTVIIAVTLSISHPNYHFYLNWWDLDDSQTSFLVKPLLIGVTFPLTLSNIAERTTHVVHAIACSQNYLIIRHDKLLQIRRIVDGTFLFAFEITKNEWRKIIPYDDRYVILADRHHPSKCIIWDMFTGKKCQEIRTTDGRMDELVLLPDQRMIVPLLYAIDTDMLILG